ncbi:hypothetical protein CCP1ISM_1580001 [Azospirillaceae bacterium]
MQPAAASAARKSPLLVAGPSNALRWMISLSATGKSAARWSSWSSEGGRGRGAMAEVRDKQVIIIGPWGSRIRPSTLTATNGKLVHGGGGYGIQPAATHHGDAHQPTNMHFDITLRSLAGPGSPALIRMITGAAVAEVLPTVFPSAQERRVDTLVELDDGRILHLEWQAGHDGSMPLRMLGYWQFVATAHPGRAIEQVVIQVGGARRIEERLESAALSFRYRVLDSRELDPAPLLASESVDDNILSLLFGTGDTPEHIRAILRRIATLGERERRDAVTRLLILSGLRGATGRVLEEVKDMPLQIDTDSDPFLAELVRKGILQGRAEGEARGEARGKAEGKAEMLLRQLRRRFGALPVTVVSKVQDADAAQLDDWSELFVDAKALSDLFPDAKH